MRKENQGEGLLPRCSPFLQVPTCQGLGAQMADYDLVNQTPFYTKDVRSSIPECFGILQKSRDILLLF